MATYYKRKGRRGIRWTARVRVDGREAAKTFATKGAAEVWAKAQERAIESGEYQKPSDGVIFADLVDRLIEHRRTIRGPLGKTASHVLARLKDKHGLEPVGTLSAAFWRRHALARMSKDKTSSQTAAADLLYAAAVVRHAARDNRIVAA